MNKQRIKEVLESRYFSFDEDENNIDFYQHTPCGEDWHEVFNFETAESFVKDLEQRVKNFDVDEEIEVWIPHRGKRGVPEKITDLIEDAEWKKQELEELLKALKEVK